MRREENFKPINRVQKVIYIYKEFGLVYLFKNYYKYATRMFLAVIISFFRHASIFLGLKKYKKLDIILTNNPIEKVTIIIPFKDTHDVLRVCVESIINKTEYKNYEIILVNNQSILPETKKLLEDFGKIPNIKILDFNEPFNYARLHNVIIDQVNTEFVLMLNNDTEVVSPDWLGHMVDIIQNNPNVGVVGPLLLFHNNTLQHAGISLGTRYGLPYHIYEGLPYVGIKSLPGPVQTICEVSAVTGACTLTRKSLYQSLGGLDENNLKVTFNDIDFCLKVYDARYHNIFTSNVYLYHYESYTRGLDYLQREKSHRLAIESNYFMKKWQKYKIDMFTGLDTRCKVIVSNNIQ